MIIMIIAIVIMKITIIITIIMIRFWGHRTKSKNLSEAKTKNVGTFSFFLLSQGEKL